MSKKSKKQQREKARRRQKRKADVSGLEHLPFDFKLVTSMPGRKISESLLAFADLELSQFTSIEKLSKVLTFASIAWNAGIATGAMRKDMIESYLSATPPDMYQETKECLHELIERKLTHFGDDQRIILDCNVTATPSGPHVSVSCAIPPV